MTNEMKNGILLANGTLLTGEELQIHPLEDKDIILTYKEDKPEINQIQYGPITKEQCDYLVKVFEAAGDEDGVNWCLKMVERPDPVDDWDDEPEPDPESIMNLRILQMEEAEKRLNIFELHPNVLRDFREGRLNKSESQMGILYWLDDEEKLMVKQFEETYGGLVYHVIKTYSNIGTVYSLLYVSKYQAEWDDDKREMEEGYPIVYVYNKDYPMYSEFGTIQIKENAGGLVRIPYLIPAPKEF